MENRGDVEVGVRLERPQQELAVPIRLRFDQQNLRLFVHDTYKNRSPVVGRVGFAAQRFDLDGVLVRSLHFFANRERDYLAASFENDLLRADRLVFPEKTDFRIPVGIACLAYVHLEGRLLAREKKALVQTRGDV